MTSVPTCSATYTPQSDARQVIRGNGYESRESERQTHPTKRFIKHQPHRLDRDIPSRPIRVGLAERPEDTGGDEATSTDGDEEGRGW